MIEVLSFTAENKDLTTAPPPELERIVQLALSLKKEGVVLLREGDSVLVATLKEKGNKQNIKISRINGKDYNRVRNPWVLKIFVEKGKAFELKDVIQKTNESFKGVSDVMVPRIGSTILAGKSIVIFNPPSGVYAALGALPFQHIRGYVAITKGINGPIDEYQLLIIPRKRKPGELDNIPEKFSVFDFDRRTFKGEIPDYVELARVLTSYGKIETVIATKTILSPQFLDEYIRYRKKLKEAGMKLTRYIEPILARVRTTREKFFSHAISTAKGEPTGVLRPLDEELVNVVYEKYKKLSEKYANLRNELVKIANDIVLLETKIREAQAYLKKTEENIEKTRQNIERLQVELKTINTAIDKLDKSIRQEKINQYLYEIERKGLEIRKKRYEAENEMTGYRYVEDVIMEFLSQQKENTTLSDERIRMLEEIAKKKPHDMVIKITKIANISVRPVPALIFHKEVLKKAKNRVKEAEKRVKSLSKELSKATERKYQIENELNSEKQKLERLIATKKKLEDEIAESQEQLKILRSKKEDIEGSVSQVGKGETINVELWLKKDENARKLYDEMVSRTENERVVKELFLRGTFRELATFLDKFRELLNEAGKAALWLTNNVGLDFESVMKNVLERGDEPRYPEVPETAAEQAQQLLGSSG